MNIEDKTALAQELAKSFRQLKKGEWHQNSWNKIKKSEFILLITMINHTESLDEGTKISELSRHLEITPAAVTHMINSLEKGGYVERLADPGDRRVVLVRATDKGKVMIKSMKEKFFEGFKGLVEFLGDKNSKELIRLLTLTYEYFKEMQNNKGVGSDDYRNSNN